MSDVSKSFVRLLNGISGLKWGISDVSGIQVPGGYLRAVSLLLPYAYSLKNYSPTKFYGFLTGKVKLELEDCIRLIEDYLKREAIKYDTVSNTQKDRQLSIGQFSHKLAAVNAGLGWIGKNTLLVTNDYGPRVRLSTILVDLDLPVSLPAEYRGCGKCNVCVEACPAKCLKGVNWEPGLALEDLMDVLKCRDKENRENQICALCLLVCPVGKERMLVDSHRSY